MPFGTSAISARTCILSLTMHDHVVYCHLRSWISRTRRVRL